MRAHLAWSTAVAGGSGARAGLAALTCNAVSAVRSERTLLAHTLVLSSMRARLAGSADCEVVGVGLAGLACDAQANLAVLPRLARQALGVRLVRLCARRAGAALDAVRANLVVAAWFAEGGEVFERALAFGLARIICAHGNRGCDGPDCAACIISRRIDGGVDDAEAAGRSD